MLFFSCYLFYRKPFFKGQNVLEGQPGKHAVVAAVMMSCAVDRPYF